MIISAIVAVAKENIIGVNNDMPWYLPSDLKWFKKITLNHHVILGRKSFESLGRPLPKRTNIIVTRDMFYAASGAIIVHSVEEALKIAEENGEEEAFILGGGQIYSLTQSIWDKLYLTEIDLEVAVKENDTVARFSQIDFSEWKETFTDCREPDERNKAAHCFRVFERMQSEVVEE